MNKPSNTTRERGPIDLRRVLTERERFLSRFVWHVVLEKPRSLRRSKPSGGGGHGRT